MKRINTTQLRDGDTVHAITPEGTFLENATVVHVGENSVHFTHGGLMLRVGHSADYIYILVKREEPLPTEIGATYKGFIRITEELWVSRKPTLDYTGKINTYNNEEVRG